MFRVNKFGGVGDSVKGNAVFGKEKDYYGLVRLDRLQSGAHSRVSFDLRWLYQD